MTLDTLKDELKAPFKANFTKNPLLHAHKNGEHLCEENLYNGNKNGSTSWREFFHRNNLDPHNTNKHSCANQNPQEIHTSGYLLFEVDWEAQHSCGNILYNGGKNGEHFCWEIFHGNNIKKHIKSQNTWKFFHHPYSLDDNEHMDTPPAFSSHAQETLNHGLSLSEVDWGDLKSDRIPSATPGAEPPRGAKDSGSARSHSTHLETSSSNRP